MQNSKKFHSSPPYFDSQFEQFRVQKINHYGIQNKAIFYFHFNIYIIEKKVAVRKTQL